MDRCSKVSTLRLLCGALSDEEPSARRPLLTLFDPLATSAERGVLLVPHACVTCWAEVRRAQMRQARAFFHRCLLTDTNYVWDPSSAPLTAQEEARQVGEAWARDEQKMGWAGFGAFFGRFAEAHADAPTLC